MKLVHWLSMCGLYVWYSEEGLPAYPLLAVPNVTAHPSTASVLITVLLCNGALFCGFYVSKGLKNTSPAKPP